MRNAKDAVVVLQQRGTRLALAALCLAASAGAPLFAAEAQNPSTVEANRIGQSANADVQPDESDLVSQGGALYSPFSTALDTAGSKPQVHSTPARRNADACDDATVVRQLPSDDK